MNVRINKPKGIKGQKIFLLIHTGYDFDPTTLAVCTTRKMAESLIKEHYKNPENADFPWNGVRIVKTTINDWVNYGQNRR